MIFHWKDLLNLLTIYVNIFTQLNGELPCRLKFLILHFLPKRKSLPREMMFWV